MVIYVFLFFQGKLLEIIFRTHWVVWNEFLSHSLPISLPFYLPLSTPSLSLSVCLPVSPSLSVSLSLAQFQQYFSYVGQKYWPCSSVLHVHPVLVWTLHKTGNFSTWNKRGGQFLSQQLCLEIVPTILTLEVRFSTNRARSEPFFSGDIDPRWTRRDHVVSENNSCFNCFGKDLCCYPRVNSEKL